MPVLNREDLEQSPLADLHQIASDLGIDGYRRLRKAELVDRLLESDQGGKPAAEAPSEGEDGGSPARAGERRPRSGAQRERSREPRQRDSERRERGAGREAPKDVEGPLTIQSSGSGFVKPAAGGEEVYVSAAQIRRLELNEGDVIGGPVRAARRSEKHPSLVRIETINGKSADEVAPPVPARTATRSRAAAKSEPELPSERIPLAGDQLLVAIDSVAPIGKGSRVVLHGGPHSGKSTAARALAGALASAGVEVFVALAGVRAEEEADWAEFKPVAVEAIDSSPDSRAKAVERALDKARRASSKDGHAALVVDAFDDLPGAAIRKTLAAAKSVPGGGSLTVVAVAKSPLGGETTVVGFDQSLAAAGRYPAIRVRSSSTVAPERLLDVRGLKRYRKLHADAAKKER